MSETDAVINHKSQGSVAIYLRCDEIFSNHYYRFMTESAGEHCIKIGEHLTVTSCTLCSDKLNIDDSMLRDFGVTLVMQCGLMVYFNVRIQRLWVHSCPFCFQVIFFKNLRQVVHTHVPLSPCSIDWYWSKGSDAVWLGR